MASLAEILKCTKLYLAAIMLQFSYAGMCIISKFALNQGMSQHVLAVYRHAIATAVIAPFGFIFDRNPRPQMTLSIFVNVMLIASLEPVIDQNLYYTGMKYSSAAFASALSNITSAWHSYWLGF
ncbi:hypothetical protein L6164_005480 [Bauhinia variegata]|uniref:Uncharacterized protein n=1 Tax=Bauhinia variegata TaxID=167791 RepID=A0ACB9PTB0_BAUVA|nr:hypothetical protein L6164_005480 [Bauhinia variegata]